MDFPLESTFDIKFTSRAFATGVPTTLAGTPAVEIYEDDSLTQIISAETLTVDFDALVGLNNLRIVATAANGFEAGKSYSAVITSGTVSGVSVVGEVICNFSISRSAAAIDLANGTDGLGALKTLLDTVVARLPAALVSGRMDSSVGAMAANVLNAAAIATDAITAAKIAADAIGASELATDAVTEITNAVWAAVTRTLTANTNLNDPSAATIADAVWDEALSGHLGAGATGAALNSAGTELAKVPKSDGTASWNATALAAINAQADLALADYDPPTKAELDAAVALLATAAELAKVPKSDGTTSWNATALAAINAQADTALADYDAPTKAEMDAGLALLATAVELAKVPRLGNTFKHRNTISNEEATVIIETP